MTITITGDAKITMGGQDVTDIIKDKDTVSIEGLGCKISVCEHESDGSSYLETEMGVLEGHLNEFVDRNAHLKCKRCGEFYR